MLALSTLAIVVPYARAANDTWKTTANGTWGLNASWTDNSVPGNNDSVTFDKTGNYTVTFDTQPAAIQSLLIQNSGTNPLFQSNMGVGPFTLNVTSALNGGTVVAGQWQHVVGTYTGGSSGTMTLFVNGVQVASGPVPLFEPISNASLRVGRTSGPNREFDGAVDEVAVYTNVLDLAQVQAQPRSGQALHFPLRVEWAEAGAAARGRRGGQQDGCSQCEGDEAAGACGRHAGATRDAGGAIVGEPVGWVLRQIASGPGRVS